MSQEQQFLNPDQQQKLFDALKSQGLLSQDIGASPSSDDSTAQNGLGNVDINTLQSLIKHAANPGAVPMQQGDQIHPMDAIHQIGQTITGGQPAGPMIAQNAPANGIVPRLLGMKTPGMSLQTPATGLIPRLLGMNDSTPVGPNHYQVIKAAGADKFLPSGLATMPDGTPYVGPETAQKALVAQRITFGQGNQTYTNKDQLTSQGIPEDAASALMAANPNGVTAKEITNYLGSERLTAQQTMANARATMAGVAKLGQALKVGGFDAAQPMAEQANKNLGNVQRAQAAIDQITANGGVANQRQRAELSAAIAQITSNSQGVLTDDRMNQFMPKSAAAQFNNWKEYWTNENGPTNFSGFLPQMQDLLIREKQANQGISNAASQLGINIMGATGQPGQASAIVTGRNNSPIFNPNNTPQQNVIPSNQRPQTNIPQPVSKPIGIKTAADYLAKFK